MWNGPFGGDILSRRRRIHAVDLYPGTTRTLRELAIAFDLALAASVTGLALPELANLQ